MPKRISEPATTFDGETLARGWLSVAIASSADPDRVQLHKTVSVECFSTGVRLVATDSYILLSAWVPHAEDELAAEPGPDEAPIITHVVIDEKGRGKGLFAHLLAVTTAKDAEPIAVRLTFAADFVPGAFPGIEAAVAIIEYPGQERLALDLYEGDYPNWRKVLAGFTGVKTDAIALNADLVGRLVKLGKIHESPLLWRFGGREKAAHLTVEGQPVITGLAMPMRWDFDRDAPLPEKATKKAEAGADA